jgi:hypothetical protein
MSIESFKWSGLSSIAAIDPWGSSFSLLNLVSFSLEGPSSVIVQSGIVKIPSDHQAQDGSAVLLARAEKTGANRSDLSGYHGRLAQSNPI